MRMDPAMYAAGIEALNVAERSPEVRSVVITGAGGVFCSGGNLQRLQANRQQPPAVQARASKACTTGSRPSAPTPSP
jgi:enoyl-CoA hydratase/carnithine racemase